MLSSVMLLLLLIRHNLTRTDVHMILKLSVPVRSTNKITELQLKIHVENSEPN
jgi:hypothetical protein